MAIEFSCHSVCTALWIWCYANPVGSRISESFDRSPNTEIPCGLRPGQGRLDMARSSQLIMDQHLTPLCFPRLCKYDMIVPVLILGLRQTFGQACSETGKVWEFRLRDRGDLAELLAAQIPLCRQGSRMPTNRYIALFEDCHFHVLEGIHRTNRRPYSSLAITSRNLGSEIRLRNCAPYVARHSKVVMRHDLTTERLIVAIDRVHSKRPSNPRVFDTHIG